MSSYLTFYLVPKKTKTKYVRNESDDIVEEEVQLTQEPLALMSYCRSSGVYQAYYETLHPAYAGDEDKYSELTYSDSILVCEEYDEEYINSVKSRLDSLYKILNAKYDSEIVDDIMSLEEYLEDNKIISESLHNISRIVYEVTKGYGDFEKVLINID